MKKIFLIGLSSFILLELFLYLFKPSAFEFYRIQKTYHKLDEEYFVDLEPNVNVKVKHFLNTFEMKFHTNQKGYRGLEEVDNSKDQIICIGDSVAMGFGVSDEETFCNKLDHFKNSSGKDYQVLNLSVDAYGPSAIYLKLKKNLPHLNAKVLYYFPSNGDNIDEEEFYKRKNDSLKNLFFKIQFQLSKYSYSFLAFKIFQENLIYRFNETFIWTLKKLQRTFNCKDKDSKNCNDIYNWEYSLKEDFLIQKKKDTNEPPKFKKDECSIEEVEFQIPESMLNELYKINQLSHEYNLKLVYFLAPIDLETAYCSQMKLHHKYYAYLSSLKKILIQKKIDFVDMNEFTTSMLDEKNRYNVKPYYIQGDGHYTAKGNEWVYQILKHKTAEILK
jgi:hypothetical protein